MSIWFILLSVALSIISAGIIVLVLLQKKRSAGLSGVVSGMNSTQTYWDKNKGRSIEGKYELWTKILGVAFMAVALTLNFVK